MASLKTFKILVPGEIFARVEEHTFMDGSVAIVETYTKSVVPSKKNQQRIGVNKSTLKPVLLPSAQHEKWEKDHLKIFNRAADKIARAGMSLPIARCKATMLFYFPDNKTRDLGNKLETIADIMKFTGIILDDAFQVFNPVLLKGYVQRDKPRTEIYLSILTYDMPEYQVDKTQAEYYESRRIRRNLLRRIKADKKRRSDRTEP